eukprot:Skav236634  [mRNA]  locus=scaffold2276:155771:159422:- [translate_table: standard]
MQHFGVKMSTAWQVFTPQGRCVSQLVLGSKGLLQQALRLLLRRVRQMERTPHEDDDDAQDAPAASRTAPSLLQRRGTFETITNVFAGAEQTLGRAFQTGARTWRKSIRLEGQQAVHFTDLFTSETWDGGWEKERDEPGSDEETSSDEEPRAAEIPTVEIDGVRLWSEQAWGIAEAPPGQWAPWRGRSLRVMGCGVCPAVPEVPNASDILPADFMIDPVRFMINMRAYDHERVGDAIWGADYDGINSIT